MTVRDYKVRHQPRDKDATATTRYKLKSPASLPSLLFPSLKQTTTTTNSYALLSRELELDYNPHLDAWQAKHCNDYYDHDYNRDSQSAGVDSRQQQGHYNNSNNNNNNNNNNNSNNNSGDSFYKNRRSVKTKSDCNLSNTDGSSSLVVLSPLLQVDTTNSDQQQQSSPATKMAASGHSSTESQQQQSLVGTYELNENLIGGQNFCIDHGNNDCATCKIDMAACSDIDTTRNDNERYDNIVQPSPVSSTHTWQQQQLPVTAKTQAEFEPTSVSCTSYHYPGSYTKTRSDYNRIRSSSPGQRPQLIDFSCQTSGPSITTDFNYSQDQSMPIVDDENFYNIIEVINNNNNNNNNNCSRTNYNNLDQNENSDSIMLGIINRFNLIRGRHNQQRTRSLITANSNSNLANYEQQQQQQQQQQQVTSRITRHNPRFTRNHMSSSERPLNSAVNFHNRQQQRAHNDGNLSFVSLDNHQLNWHQQHRFKSPNTIMCRSGMVESSESSLDHDSLIDGLEFSTATTSNDIPLPASKTRQDSYKQKDISDTMTICSTISNVAFCKICHVGSKRNDKLISPCKCSGTMQFIHCGCLLKWLEISNRDPKKALSCELCNYEYLWHTKFDPRCRRFPNCSCKDMFLHSIFVACLMTMLACSIIFVMFVNDTNLDGLQTTSSYHHSSSSNQRYPISHQANHTELSPAEKTTLLCGATLFICFFLAMYVQIKAKDTLYKLLVKFIYLNQKFYITEYDHSINNNNDHANIIISEQQNDKAAPVSNRLQ